MKKLKILVFGLATIATSVNSELLQNVSNQNIYFEDSALAFGGSDDICTCEVVNSIGRKDWCNVQTSPTDRYGSGCHCTEPLTFGKITGKKCNK